MIDVKKFMSLTDKERSDILQEMTMEELVKLEVLVTEIVANSIKTGPMIVRDKDND